GVTYVYQAQDDGAMFSSLTPGKLSGFGARGDVRLGGKTYGGSSSTLASNFYPDMGEMMINTDANQVSFLHNQNNEYRAFRNIIMHEAMHGLGINHVTSTTSQFLIEPFVSPNPSFDGPQLDDILALQRLYGDANEKAGGNDTYGTATPLGEVGA